ncbi:hypothetical protein [Candidatus Palauibacter soopunensis]|uniref:hypothetical protein n=1 Tax=Candidatus Palauibacter soopunensis TaxID=3056739 RepID=UPI0023A3AF64|nr:hypothetical protein [Candidatus Palauibacter soopunensis]MDE2879375.1 hypothetical protein [Candidatus Palauibacter soopunensis]
MRASAAALASLAALAGLSVATPAAAQTTDTVFVRLDADGAAHVRQGLEPEAGAVRAFAIRIEHQTLSLTEMEQSGAPLPVADAALTPVDGAYRIDVVSDAPVVVSYTVRNTVRGRLDRIPFFVAGREAEQTVVQEVTAPWLIRLEGDPDVIDALDLSTSLPRFVRAGDDVVTATLSSVPGLLRLSRGGALSFARLADFVVLALLLTGAIWTWRNARARRDGVGAAR